MTRFAESYAVWLADYYLLATVLLTLALAAAALLKQPAQRLMVTKSTFVALVLLAVLCALPGWSIVHLLAADQPPTPVEAIRDLPVVHSDIVKQSYLNQSNTFRRPELPTSAPQTADEDLPQPNKPKMSWPALLATAHLAGMGCVVAWLTLGWVASLRLRRTAQPAPANVSAILHELANLNSPVSRRSRLFTHDRLDVAVALGVLRPMILLPRHWTKSQSHDRLRAVLAHESAHVLNHDLHWVAVARILFVALWANPLFWLMKRRLRLDQEALADAAAAEVSSRQEYAEQLVAWARNVSSRPALHLSSAVGLWEGPSQLRQRIAILLDEQLTVIRNCSRRWRVATALTLIAGAAILSLVTIQPAPSQAAAEETKSHEADAPAATKTGALTMRFEYDGVPPERTELKEFILRAKLDNRELGRIDVEKEIGAKVFDESLLVGKDGGIANVFVWLISKDFPRIEPGDKSPPKQWDEKQEAYVPLEYKGPPVTITYQKGQYEPRVTAFEWPRQVVVRNGDPKSTNYFNYLGTAQLQDTWTLVLKPGEEWKVDVHPARRIPGRLSVRSRVKEFKAWVLPCDNPFFAVSDVQGRIQISGLPPGKWEFQVWHERSGYLKTAKWPRGRFTLEIKPGDNNLGTVKLSPAVFNEPQGGSGQPQDSSVPAESPPQRATLPRTAPRQQSNTITGSVVDEKGQPIAGAEALLFRVNRIDSSRKLQAKKLTDANGNYRFENVVDIAKEFPGRKFNPLNNTFDPLEEEMVQVYVRAPGRVAGMGMDLRQRIAMAGNVFDMTMKPAATLTGRVTGPNGNPVGGALVTVGGSSMTAWDEVQSARTKPDGTYVISDAAPYGIEEYRKQAAEQNRRMEAARSKKENTYSVFVMPPVLTVSHPDFATKNAIYEKIPGKQDVKLEPAAIVEGRAIYGDSAKPAAGVIVHLSTSQPKNGKPGEDSFTPNPVAIDVRTDAEGKYRFQSLPAASYDLSAEMRGWVNIGIDAFAAPSGKISTAPNLVLTKGGVISVRLINDKTGKPIPLAPHMRADIAAHKFPFITNGISRPNWDPSTAPNSTGRFELHALPGKRAVMLFQVVEDGEVRWYAKPSGEKPTVVDLEEGKTVEVDMPVVDKAVAAPWPQADVVLFPTSPQIYGSSDGHSEEVKSKPPAKTESPLGGAAEKNDGENTSTPKAAEKSAKNSPPANKPIDPKNGNYEVPITVTGRAIDDTAQPIAGAQVYLASPRTNGKPLAATISDNDGTYRFEGVRLPIEPEAGKTDVGSIEVFAQAKGFGLAWRPLKWIYPKSAHGDRSTIQEPGWDSPRSYGTEDPIELDIRFGPAKSLRGRIVNDAGEPIPNTPLAIRRAELLGDRNDNHELESLNWPSLVPESIKVRRSDNDGRFTFTALPANYRFWIDVRPPGYTEHGIYAATQSGPHQEVDGIPVFGDDFEVVFNRPRTVKLRVVYGDTQKPAPKVGIGGNVMVAGFWETTDDNGFVSVPLPDGKYKLGILPRHSTPYMKSEAEVAVSEKSANDVTTLMLHRAAEVDIQVVDANSNEPLSGVDVWIEDQPAEAANPHRQVHGYRSWEVETRISHYESPTSDEKGRMRVLFEPGKCRIGIGLQKYPKGYEPVEPNGKLIELKSGKPQSIQFQMRKQAQPTGSAETKKNGSGSAVEDPAAKPAAASDDKHGSQMLRDIRAAAAPLLATMAKEHGYGLKPGQDIVRVAPPFAPIRMEYFRVGHPTQSQAIPRGPSAMLFHWANGRLENRGMTFGQSADSGYDLLDLLNAIVGLKSQNIELEPGLPKTDTPGDWVVRTGVEKTALVKQLEKILQNELSLPIRLEFREVNRPVYIARGAYKLAPLPGHKATSKLILTDETLTTDEIEIFGKELVPNSGSGGGTDHFDVFLNWLGRWIGTPIVSEVTKLPSNQLSWHLNERSPYTSQMNREDHDPKLVLANITAQTGLEFIQENRPVKILFVERAPK